MCVRCNWPVEENKDSNTKHRYGEVMQAQMFSDKLMLLILTITAAWKYLNAAEGKYG